MPDGQSPSTARRRLRGELKSLRERTGLSLATVADKLDWSQSKLIRIENGSVGVAVVDVRALLGLYKASEATVDELVTLARSARERPWWHRYGDVVSPQLQEFMGFEADAKQLLQFHPTLVPGLLQIEPYFRAIGSGLTLTPISDERFESLVQVRLRRQTEILQGKSRPAFTAIVDEAVLHRQVGGEAVMRAQLRHLADVQDEGLVSFGIIPFSAGAHFGMMGAFHLMDFGDADDPLLYLENAQNSVFLQDKQDVVAQYRRRFDELLDMSLRGKKAVALLHSLIRQA